MLVCWFFSLTRIFLFILFISFVLVWFALLIIIVKHTFNSSILYCYVIFSVNLPLRCVKVNHSVYILAYAFAIVQNWSTMHNFSVNNLRKFSFWLALIEKKRVNAISFENSTTSMSINRLSNFQLHHFGCVFENFDNPIIHMFQKVP